MPKTARDSILGIDWSGRTCNTINVRTQPVYAKAKRLALQWDADAVDGSREKEAAAWLVQASDALFLRTNDLDRRQSDPIKYRMELFLAGDWERVWGDFSRDAETMLEATRIDAPSTPEPGFDLGQGFRVPQHDIPPPAVSEVRRFDQALKMCKLGRLGDAVRALMPAKRAPRNDETLAKVREFFPAPAGDELDMESLRSLLAGRDVEEAFSLDAFVATIRDADRGKAADRFGCRAEHVQALLGTEDGRAAIALMRKRELAIFAGKAPTSIPTDRGRRTSHRPRKTQQPRCPPRRGGRHPEETRSVGHRGTGTSRSPISFLLVERPSCATRLRRLARHAKVSSRSVGVLAPQQGGYPRPHGLGYRLSEGLDTTRSGGSQAAGRGGRPTPVGDRRPVRKLVTDLFFYEH